jgi:Holliday junction resolvase RusA-like endonuclease
MAVQVTPLFEDHPTRAPTAWVAGRTVSLSFFIAGTPLAKARPRARVVQPKGGKAWVQFYSDDKSVAWEDTVGVLAKQQIMGMTVQGNRDFRLPLEGRTIITLRFNLTKPASYSKSVVHMVKKPDVDNLSKAVLDGLVKARILADDNAITDNYVYKRYVAPGHPEGVEVDLTVVTDG